MHLAPENMSHRDIPIKYELLPEGPFVQESLKFDDVRASVRPSVRLSVTNDACFETGFAVLHCVYALFFVKMLRKQKMQTRSCR